MKIINGDLIKLTLGKEFDIIVHGCNCFCTQGAGIALSMSRYFNTLNPIKYPGEHITRKGDINKLGNIEYSKFRLPLDSNVIVINAYTQYTYGNNSVNYNAISLCLMKINFMFSGQNIGMPKIGCGLAGGDWNIVANLIDEHMYNMNVTVVEYNP